MHRCKQCGNTKHFKAGWVAYQYGRIEILGPGRFRIHDTDRTNVDDMPHIDGYAICDAEDDEIEWVKEE